jgi:hypothetical protein
MDINKLFNIFQPEISEPKTDLIDLYEHPYYWIGMFKKIMTNHKLFSEKFIMLCSNLDPTLRQVSVLLMKEHGFILEK